MLREVLLLPGWGGRAPIWALPRASTLTVQATGLRSARIPGRLQEALCRAQIMDCSQRGKLALPKG